MPTLTRAEEELMHLLWDLGEATVGDIRDRLAAAAKDGKKPPHSTISTMMRILVDKEFCTYKAYGRSFLYRPLVSRDEYSRGRLKRLIGSYFGGSTQRLVSFLVEGNDLSLKELSELTARLEEE